MDQKTIQTGPNPEITVEQVLGSLDVKGWEREVVEVSARLSELSLEEGDGKISLGSRGSLALRLPVMASVKVEDVHGQARIKQLQETLAIETVHGSLVLRDVADIELGTVHGELFARDLAGEIHAEQVMGNAMLRDIDGECDLAEVMGNFHAREVTGNIKTSARGNAHIRLSVLAGERYEVDARGNIYLRIPAEASARLTLTSEARRIQVKLPGEKKSIQQADYEFTLGDGRAAITLSAGGTIFISSQEGEWDMDEDREAEFERGFAGIHFEIGEQIGAQISAQMEAVSRQINEEMSRLSETLSQSGMSAAERDRIVAEARQNSERATARAQERMRRAQEKLDRKMEAVQRRAETHAQRHAGRSWGMSWGAPRAEAPKETVSDDERLMILKMLEQKKISLDEAEELLRALEGNQG
jgi:hypothetical protein